MRPRQLVGADVRRRRGAQLAPQRLLTSAPTAGYEIHGLRLGAAQATGPLLPIAAGYDHALALRADGSVVGWGNNYMGAVTIPTGLSNVIGLAAGGEFEEEWSLVLQGDGRPTLLAQPFSRAAVAGDTVAFRALAVGKSPLSYGWLFNGQPIPGLRTRPSRWPRFRQSKPAPTRSGCRIRSAQSPAPKRC